MKTGNHKYKNPKARTKYQIDFNKNTYTTLIFRVNKKTDKGIIDYFKKADNKTQALRDLFK